MKYLPVLVVHAISSIFRSGGKADLNSVDRERSTTSKYQNIDVWRHWLWCTNHAIKVSTHSTERWSLITGVLLWPLKTVRDQLPQNIKYWDQWMQTVVADTNTIVVWARHLYSQVGNTSAISVHKCATCCHEDAALYCTGCTTSCTTSWLLKLPYKKSMGGWGQWWQFYRSNP